MLELFLTSKSAEIEAAENFFEVLCLLLRVHAQTLQFGLNICLVLFKKLLSFLKIVIYHEKRFLSFT